jgi:hypothetical protein
MQLPSCLAVLIAAPMQKPTGASPHTQSVRVAISTARIRKRHFSNIRPKAFSLCSF